MLVLFVPHEAEHPFQGQPGDSVRAGLTCGGLLFCLLPCYTINSLPEFLAFAQPMMFLPPSGGDKRKRSQTYSLGPDVVTTTLHAEVREEWTSLLLSH